MQSCGAQRRRKKCEKGEERRGKKSKKKKKKMGKIGLPIMGRNKYILKLFNYQILREKKESN